MWCDNLILSPVPLVPDRVSENQRSGKLLEKGRDCIQKRCKRKKASHYCEAFVVLIIVAATYFTGFEPSIIGGSGLNFSVRDGKR